MNFYGLFGKSLGHSISPEIHKKIYEVAGIEAAYKKFEISKEELLGSLDAMKILGIKGANVTIPYKEDFIPLLNNISPLAKRLHSVNTIKNDGEIFTGYNTDYDGIALTFELKNWVVKNKSAYILGSGGASHAVAHFLKDQGAASITIVSRTPQNLEGPWEFIDYNELEKREGDFLINCTPVGMYPNIDASPVSEVVIKKFNCLFDMTYNPAETLFLKIGKKLDKDTINGLDMLVGQAICSVEIWEDREISEVNRLEILAYFRENWKGAE